jgi:hypothetical protein
MNLENLNLVELMLREVQETEGGFIHNYFLFYSAKSSLAYMSCSSFGSRDRYSCISEINTYLI